MLWCSTKVLSPRYGTNLFLPCHFALSRLAGSDRISQGFVIRICFCCYQGQLGFNPNGETRAVRVIGAGINREAHP